MLMITGMPATALIIKLPQPLVQTQDYGRRFSRR